jgi:hypothetical protein
LTVPCVDQEFIRFLDAIERVVPAGKMIQVVVDNYAAHEHGTGVAAAVCY